MALMLLIYITLSLKIYFCLFCCFIIKVSFPFFVYGKRHSFVSPLSLAFSKHLVSAYWDLLSLTPSIYKTLPYGTKKKKKTLLSVKTWVKPMGWAKPMGRIDPPSVIYIFPPKTDTCSSEDTLHS